MSNYDLMKDFIEIIKEFAIENPDKIITGDFIYSNLMEFNVQNNQGPCQDISNIFNSLKKRYKNSLNVDIYEIPNKAFLWFESGKIKGNELKIYIPLDKKHIEKGSKIIFDFIAKSNMEYRAKIATIIRNDDLIIRVNKIEDANAILNFVLKDKYLLEGMIRVNPFLPNIGSIGITMDNSYSYNSVLCNIIRDFIIKLKFSKRMDMCTLENLNTYIKRSIENVPDLDLKDIYILLSKTTSKDFSFQDFVAHAQNKLIDKYTSDKKRITDPNYYFEQAVISTSKDFSYNGYIAIKEYLNGNPNFFSNNNERMGLIKYVQSKDLILLMRAKLQKNNIKIPISDDELIKSYIALLLNKDKNLNDSISYLEIIKQAFLNTLKVYNMNQATTALFMLLQKGNVMYFTNKFKDRQKLISILSKTDIKKVILSNIDINGLDFNNVQEIVFRFVNTLNLNQINQVKVS